MNRLRSATLATVLLALAACTPAEPSHPADPCGDTVLDTCVQPEESIEIDINPSAILDVSY